MPEYRTYNGRKLLCVTPQSLVKCGISINVIKDGLKRYRQGKVAIWPHHKEGRQVYLHYDGLGSQYCDIICRTLCAGQDPHQYATGITSLEKYLPPVAMFTGWFDDYILPDGRRLPVSDRAAYVEASRWLNMLSGAKKGKQYAGMGFRNLTDLIATASGIVKAEKLRLPSNPRRLAEKLQEFEEKGHVAVIKNNYCNNNSTRVSDDMKALIRDIYSRHNQYPAEQIAAIIRTAASEKGWPMISAQTIRNHISDIEMRSFRHGVEVWRNTYDFVVRRRRPSAPNLLWVGDATPMELFYQEAMANKNGHQVVKYWKRKVVYMITDAYNDLVVGYAVGDSENNALAKLAWKHACVTHGVLPHQIKVDNFGIAEMRPFYQAIALNKDWFTPAAVGNARDKTVEQSFAKLNNLVLRRFPNYAGANITAKHQPNRDYLNKIRHSFPDENGVLEQIDVAIYAWNNAVRESGISLREQWESADRSRDRRMTITQRLQLFGTPHRYRNSLTQQGVQLTLEGTTYRYMHLDAHFYVQNVGKQFELIYDDWDPGHILARSEDHSITQVMELMNPVPMAYADMNEGDRRRLNRILDMKKQVKQIVLDRKAADTALLSDAGIDSMAIIDAEGYAKGMFPIGGTMKHLLQDANSTLKGDRLSDNAADDDDDPYVRLATSGIYDLPKKETDE